VAATWKFPCQLPPSGPPVTICSPTSAGSSIPRSCRIHSRYTLKIADQPIGRRGVTIHLHCRALGCPRRIFTEQTSLLAARYARRSVSLQRLMHDVGLIPRPASAPAE
jgi:hypothetical protein